MLWWPISVRPLLASHLRICCASHKRIIVLWSGLELKKRRILCGTSCVCVLCDQRPSHIHSPDPHWRDSTERSDRHRGRSDRAETLTVDTQRIQRTQQPTRIVRLRATYTRYWTHGDYLPSLGIPTGVNQSSSGSRPELHRAIPMPMPLAVRIWRAQSPFSGADPGPCEDAAARVISACHRRRC